MIVEKWTKALFYGNIRKNHTLSFLMPPYTGVSDWVDYSGNDAVDINLNAQTATGVGSDSVLNIEHVIGSNVDDIIEGNSASNTLQGGTGTDTVSFSQSGNSVTINMASGTASGDGTDTITDFEKAIGSAQDDVFIGGVSSSTLDGAGGEDTANYSAEGALTVGLNSGDDTVGSDTLQNVEKFIFSNNGDTINISSAAAYAEVISLDARSGTDTINFTNTSETLVLGTKTTSVENITLAGSSSLDARGVTTSMDITGGAGDNTIMIDADMGTIDGAGGINTLDVSADLDLGAMTLTNIDKIQTDNALTMDNVQLHNQTIDLSGAGSMIFSANTTSGNNNYANITSSLTAGLIMIVASGLTLAAGDNLGEIDKVELQSGTLTLDASKLDAKDIEIANGGTVVINNADGQNLENLKLSSAGAVTINVSDGDSTLDASGIDVTAFTGTVTINDGTGSDTITGTAKVDVINSTAGADTIKSGGGDDTIMIDSLPAYIDGGGDNDTLIINGSMDLTGITISNIESIMVNSGYVATLTDTQTGGKTVSGAGSVVVNVANDNVDLSNITTSGTANKAVFSTTRDMRSGDLSTMDSVEVTGGTLSVTDTVLGSKPVSGAGNIIVEVSSSTNQDFNTLSLGGTETIQFTGNATFGGDFQNSSVLVDSGKILTVAIGKIDGKTVTNNGIVNVTNLDQKADADLSLINGTAIATSNTDVTFTGNLGTVALTVDASTTFTADASVVSAKSITNNGTVEVTALDATLAADFSTITGTKHATWDSATAEFIGDLNGASVTVDNGEMRADIAKVDTLTIDGNGAVKVTNIDSNNSADLSNMTPTTVSAISDGNVNFVGKLGMATLTVDAGTFTVTDDILGIRAVDGVGDIVVRIDSNSAQNFNTISDTLNNIKLEFRDNNTEFMGSFADVDEIQVYTKRLTVTDDILGAHTIKGSGNVTVEIDSNSSKDYTTVITTTGGSNKAEFTATNTFDGTLTDFASVEVSGGELTIADTIIKGKNVTGTGKIKVTIAGDSDIDMSSIVVGAADESVVITGTSLFTGDFANTGTISVTGTLTTDIAKVDDKTISNSGTIEVTNLDSIADADLSNIDGVVHATSDDDVIFTGKLGVATLTVSAGIFTITDDILGTRAVDGDGNITVQVNGDSAQDFNTLSLNGTETIQFTNNAVFAGDFRNSTVSVDSGKTLTLTDDTASGHTITGDGGTKVQIGSSSSDTFSHIETVGTNVAEFSSTSTFSGSLAEFSTVTNSGTLTIDSTIVNGHSVSNTGTVNVTSLNATTGLDLSTINGTVNADWSGTDIFTGNLSTATTTVSSGTMSADIAIVDGKTINGTGTVEVLNIDSVSNANLSSITATTVHATSDNDVVFTGDLGSATLTVDSGTFTVTDNILGTKVVDGTGNITVQVDGNSSQNFNNLSIAGAGVETIQFTNDAVFTGNFQNSTVSVDSGKILTVAIDKIDGKTVTNSGTVEVTDLDTKANADLSAINGTAIATSNTDVTFIGNLGSVALTVDNGTTFTADASVVSAKSITNNGTVAITNLDGTLGANLATISGTKTATWDGNGTFSGDLSDTSVTVASGTLTADVAKIEGKTIGGVGTVSLTNLDNNTNADFTNVNPTTLNVDWSGTATYSGNLINVDSVNISSGVMSVNDSILGTTSVIGNALTVTTDDASADLSNVNVTTLIINDTTSGVNITGSDNVDILNLSSGNDTVNLGASNDMINVDIVNLDSSDTISDTSGSDTINFTTSGTIDMTNLSNVSGIETLQMSSSDDTLTFADKAEFDSVIGEFDIVDGGGNDAVSFDSAVSGDLDFTKLSEFETLNLSASGDTVTLSGDEPATVNGLGGDDTFTLDFSNVTTVDAGAGVDTAKFSVSTVTANDTNFSGASNVSNIDVLDIAALTINGADSEELIITKAMIQGWSDADDDITLKLTSDQLENIQVTADDDSDAPDAGTTTFYAFENGHTYDFGEGVTLTAEVV